MCWAKCASEHATKDCKAKANMKCSTAYLANVAHAASDRTKCPILRKKMSQKRFSPPNPPQRSQTISRSASWRSAYQVFYQHLWAPIFDCSLQAGIFPSAWKQAIVRPISKRHPPLELEHLRPISILSAPSTILETIANKQLSEFITRNDLLDQRESGFRKEHSIHTALVSIVDDIRKAIDIQKIVLAGSHRVQASLWLGEHPSSCW